MELSFQGKIGV